MAGSTIKEQVLQVEVTLTDNGTATVDAAIQFSDIAGNAVSHPVAFLAYLSTDSAGQTLATDGTDTTEIAAGTDGTILVEHVTDIMFTGVSEADGDFDLTVTVVDTKEVYLNIVLPNGEVYTYPTALYYTS